VQELWDLI
jgi:hypothetical protein